MGASNSRIVYKAQTLNIGDFNVHVGTNVGTARFHRDATLLHAAAHGEVFNFKMHRSLLAKDMRSIAAICHWKVPLVVRLKLCFPDLFKTQRPSMSRGTTLYNTSTQAMSCDPTCSRVPHMQYQ